MWRWLEVWLEYLQELWGHGALVLFMVFAAAFQGLLVIGAPALIIASLFARGDAWDAVDGWFYLSAIVWFPIFLGNLRRHFKIDTPSKRPGLRPSRPDLQ
jgi:hypothetical protein